MRHSIAIIIRDLMVGGAQKQALLLAKNMKEHHTVYIIVQKKQNIQSKHQKFIKENNLTTFYLDNSYIKSIRKLAKFLKQREVTIGVSYLTSDNLLLALSKLVRKKMYAIGGLRNCWISKPKLLLNKLLTNTILDHILLNNKMGEDFFGSKGFERKKLHTIFNCIEISGDTIERKRTNDYRILSVGRFVEQKDYFTALKVFMEIQQSLPNKKIRYIIIGHGEMEQELINFVSNKNIKNVEIINNPPDLKTYYRNADIYLCTSIFEGLSNTIMEALLYNLPIIATDVGDNNILVKDNINGYLVEKENVAQIAFKVIELINDTEKRIKFGIEGRKHLQNNFSEEVFKNNYLNFFESKCTKF